MKFVVHSLTGRKVDAVFNTFLARGGGRLPYEIDGDARRLALGCKFWILVSLRVFQAQHQYMKPPRNTELREQEQKLNFLFNSFCFRICVPSGEKLWERGCL